MNTTSQISLRTALSVLTALLIASSMFGARASAASNHRPAHSSIKAVVLTTGDVTKIFGGTFRAFINGVVSNKDLASAEGTVKSSVGPGVTSMGRVTGYTSVWFRGTKTSSLSVTNAVSEYKNSTFLQAEFGQLGHQMKAIKGVVFHLSPLSGVGDEAFMLTEQSHGTTARGIVFRRGNYVADIVAGAQHGTVSLSSVAKLAAIEDHRIQANG